MSDTTEKFAELVARRHADMSPEERMRIASDMFDTARKIVESSLPDTFSVRDRRLAIARRFYGGELPDAVLNAFADWREE